MANCVNGVVIHRLEEYNDVIQGTMVLSIG